MISDYKNEGLKMIDIKSFNKAHNQHGSKNIWTTIKMVIGNSSFILNYTISDLKGNLNKDDLAKFIHVSDAFTTEILTIT